MEASSNPVLPDVHAATHSEAGAVEKPAEQPTTASVASVTQPACPSSPDKLRRSMSPCPPPFPARLPSLESIQTKATWNPMPPPPPRPPPGDNSSGSVGRRREASPLPGQGSPLRYRRSVSPPLPGQGSPLPQFKRSVSPPLCASGSPLRLHRSVSPPLDRGIHPLSALRVPPRVGEGTISPPVLPEGHHTHHFRRSASPVVYPNRGRALSPPLGPQQPSSLRTVSPPVPWTELKGEKRKWPSIPQKESEERGSMGPPKQRPRGSSHSDGGTSKRREITSSADQGGAFSIGGGSESDTSSNDGGSVGGGGGASSGSSRHARLPDNRLRVESPHSGVTGISETGEALANPPVDQMVRATSSTVVEAVVNHGGTTTAATISETTTITDMFGDPVANRPSSIRGGAPGPEELELLEGGANVATKGVNGSLEEDATGSTKDLGNGSESGTKNQKTYGAKIAVPQAKRPPVPIFKAPANVQNGAKAEGKAGAKPTMGPPPVKKNTPAGASNGAPDKPLKENQPVDQAPPKPKAAPAQGPPYAPPSWGAPPGQPFKMEVLKEGQVLTQLDVAQKGAYMFGRSDRADFLLEHATISRYHAVLQFRATGEAFIYDLGSTHGTSINKNQVKPKVHVPLRVGDIVRFGRSSRLYVFQGPQELMPEEGLSKTERRALRQLEAAQEAKLQAASLARAREAASEADGISWGQQEDAIEEVEEEQDLDELTWRTYNGPLTDKQQKTLEKVQKRETKIANLQSEIERIQSKEIAQGGLTQGQQTQIARNEQRLEVLQEELESLEETLNESIRESLGAKRKNEEVKGGKRKGPEDSDGEGGESDEDEFYDRAGSVAKKRKSQKDTKESFQVETAESLLDKECVLLRERHQVQQQLEEERLKDGAPKGESSEGLDALDAFMSNVSSEIDKDRAHRLERELKALDDEISRIGRLLKIADPMNEARQKWVAGPELAETSSSTHAEFAKIEKQQRATPKVAEERHIGTPAKVTASVVLPQAQLRVPTREPEGAEPKPSPAARESEGETLKTEHENQLSASPRQVPAGQSQSVEEQKSQTGQEQKSQSQTGQELESQIMEEPKSQSQMVEEQEGPSQGGPKAKKGKGGPKRRVVKGPLRPPTIEQLDEEPVSAVEEWTPPVGQTGDGKTSLNERFGY